MPLRIFISHKMPTDTALAEQIGSKLALYAGNQVTVTHAGQFRYGENWRARIHTELDAADWLIFLYTDQDEDWGFCLYECGYFQSRMERDPDNKRLLLFCREGDKPSPALGEYKAVNVAADSILELLKDIYYREPWAFSPKLAVDELRRTSEDILADFTSTETIELNREVATSVILEFVLNDQNQNDLIHGRLPGDARVTGTRDWQRLFGKDISTGGWLWKALVEDWPYRETYEFLIAGMVQDAMDGLDSRSTAIRPPDANELYRLTLRRYQRIAGKKYRFFFTLSLLDLPFEVPLQPGQKATEVVFYHLLNLSWYCRRRIVDQLYEGVLEELSKKKPDCAKLNRIFGEIRYELMNLSAQAVIRGIDNPLLVRRAFASADPSAAPLLERMKSWQDLQDHIFQSMERGAEGLTDIARDLYEMANQNFEFYRKVAAAYATVVQGISPPSAP
jgi:hypothetical protein